jgi:hypothetical protein
MSLQEVRLGKMMVEGSTKSETRRVGDDGGLLCS